MEKKTRNNASVKSHHTSPASGNTVIVALNHPHGIHFALPNGKRVTVKGNATSLRGKEKGSIPAGAFGLTPVEADVWAYIEKTYGNMDIFKNGLILAQDSKSRAQDAADERMETRHGREPVDPTKTKTQEATGLEQGI